MLFRSLRPLSIPLHNGHLWRAGVVLTDLLGFTRKLDKYADIDEDHDNVAIRPVEKLLRNSLRKLNGSSFLARSLRSVSGYDLPLTIERTLRFLENFPEDSKGFKVYEYGFLSQMENSLMRNRLKGTLNPDSKGELPWLYAHAVQDMIKKIPVSWFEQLEIKTNLTSTPGYHLRQTLGGCDNEKPNT